jgi:thioredoxin 1
MRLSYALLGVLTLFSLSGCRKAEGSASASATTRAPSQAVRLAAPEFRKLAEQAGGTYLDVRTPGEVARGHLPNASVIDFHDPKFKQKVELLPKDKPTFVYCASGNRSGAAAEMMVQMGFKQVYDLQGGIGAWVSAGYPIERSDTAAPDGSKAMEPHALDTLLHRNQRVLVDYHTPWCAPCRRMNSVVDTVAEAWKGRAVVVRVDIGESEALAAREKIQGVPVFVVYINGKERWRGSGELPREVLEAQLAKP